MTILARSAVRCLSKYQRRAQRDRGIVKDSHRELGPASGSSSDNSGKGEEREFHDDIIWDVERKIERLYDFDFASLLCLPPFL